MDERKKYKNKTFALHTKYENEINALRQSHASELDQLQEALAEASQTSLLINDNLSIAKQVMQGNYTN